ncbi:ParA family protein [Limosilactobacillus fermentum]
MLSKLKQNYDYIFIDVPPTINVFTNNAIMASDFGQVQNVGVN